MNWKKFYLNDFNRNIDLVRRKINEVWKERDTLPAEYLSKGGFLSIPHTYLSTSIEPILRTLKAIHSSGKDQCLFLGVLHGYSKEDIEKEFSTDLFFKVKKMLEKELRLKNIPVKVIFLIRNNKKPQIYHDVLSRSSIDSTLIKENINDDTAIITTGDLIHYGRLYGNENQIENMKEEYLSLVDSDLNTLYIEKDLEEYYHRSKAHLNDQLSNAMALLNLYDGKLEYKIFDNKLADYSDILKTPDPAFVASIFYGIKPT